MFYSPAPLHIPDGFLSVLVSIICWVITVITLGIAISKTNKSLGERQVPLMGVMAAFIFAAQMINYPVLGGTSGHLLGGALAAITLGPWAGILVMTAVITVQGLLFQDGGLLAMGANILNMGLLTAGVGYGLYRSVLGKGRGIQLAVAGVAAWLSVMAGALATSLQLWLSGTSDLRLVIPAMLSVHALIGLGEALVTVLNEKGIPTPLVHTMMGAPQSRMDVITPAEQEELINASRIAKIYNEVIDRNSAYEILNGKIAAPQSNQETPLSQEKEEKQAEASSFDLGSTLKNIANSSVTKTIIKEVTRGIFGVLMGSSSRNTSRRKKTTF